MGSGCGGNLTCNGVAHPPSLVPDGEQAGGIVVLLGGNVAVSASGAITANGQSIDDRTASSGGYVLVRGGVVSLGTSQVMTEGGVTTRNDAGFANAASAGFIAVLYKTSVTGTTAPAAFTQQVANP